MTSFTIFVLLSQRDNEREILAPLISHDVNVLVVIAIEKHNVMLIHEPVVTAVVCLSVCVFRCLSFLPLYSTFSAPVWRIKVITIRKRHYNSATPSLSAAEQAYITIHNMADTCCST